MSDERADPRSPGFQGNSPYKQHLMYRYMYSSKYINKNDTVLDIPCGVGWGTSTLIPITSNLYGLDICSDAVKYGESRWSPPIKFTVGNMLNTSYSSNFFDVVVCVEGYEHVNRDDQCILLKEVNRVLKPKGIIVLSTPISIDDKQSGNPYHLYEPSETEFLHRVAVYFKIIDIKPYQLPELNHVLITAIKNNGE